MPFHRKNMKVSTKLHNQLHKQLKVGQLTIKDLIKMGISIANAYIIKNHMAYTIPRIEANAQQKKRV